MLGTITRTETFAGAVNGRHGTTKQIVNIFLVKTMYCNATKAY